MIAELKRSSPSLTASERGAEPNAPEVVITLRLEVRIGSERHEQLIADPQRIAAEIARWPALVSEALARTVHDVCVPADTRQRPDPRNRSGGVENHKRGMFCRDGDVWLLGYEGVTARLRHSRGLAILAHLLRNPGEEVPVRLLHAITPTRTASHAATPDNALHGQDLVVDGLGNAGEILDARAFYEYRRCLADLREELSEAERDHDLARADRAREQIEAISDQLRSAVGLGGRSRRACSEIERLRIAITHRVRSAIARIREHVPALGEHLATSVQTGCCCAYKLPADKIIEWEL
jgi:hypothetical protein